MMMVKTDKGHPPPPPHLPTNTLQQNKDTKVLGMMLIGFPAHIPFLKNNESSQIPVMVCNQALDQCLA